MKNPTVIGNYGLINLIFTGVILAVIGYSIVFGGERKHPIPSGSEILTGEKSISTGLSRSFSAIVRFDFDAARQYNPYGIRIFVFLMIQLAMRITGLFLSRKSFYRHLVLADVLISIALFLIFFFPFLENSYEVLGR